MEARARRVFRALPPGRVLVLPADARCESKYSLRTVPQRASVRVAGLAYETSFAGALRGALASNALRSTAAQWRSRRLPWVSGIASTARMNDDTRTKSIATPPFGLVRVKGREICPPSSLGPHFLPSHSLPFPFQHPSTHPSALVRPAICILQPGEGRRSSARRHGDSSTPSSANHEWQLLINPRRVARPK